MVNCAFTERDFIELLDSNFKNEIEMYKLKFKILKLNDLDVLLMVISDNNKRRMNSTVMETNIKFSKTMNEDGNYEYIINVYDDDLETLFTKIKKTIFDICLVK